MVCGACISLVSLPIVPNSGGDLWWFAVICVGCGGLQWFVVVCLLVIPQFRLSRFGRVFRITV